MLNQKHTEMQTKTKSVTIQYYKYGGQTMMFLYSGNMVETCRCLAETRAKIPLYSKTKPGIWYFNFNTVISLS